MITVDCPFCDLGNDIDIDIFDHIDFSDSYEEEVCEFCNSTFSFNLSVDLEIDVYNIKKEKSAFKEENDESVEPFFEDKYTMPLF